MILTHHKCATNWIRGIVTFLDAPVKVETNARAASLPAEDTPHLVHFVRDPRDALVSNYWSWRKSHLNNNEQIIAFRERAESMTVEEGLLDLIDIFPMGNQLKTWPEWAWEQCTRVKYEDLLADFTVVRQLFPMLELTKEQVAEAQEATAFERIANRKRGEEDVNSHFRKATPKDWKNYFTPAVTEKFNKRHGWAVERLGY